MVCVIRVPYHANWFTYELNAGVLLGENMVFGGVGKQINELIKLNVYMTKDSYKINSMIERTQEL